MTNRFDEVVREARSAVDALSDSAERALRDARQYLASPRGRRMRENMARGLIAVAPVIAGTPFLRRSRLVRILGVAGAATALVKVAEAIRDWDPEGRTA